MKEFGIDFTKEVSTPLRQAYMALRETYYTMKAERLKALSRKYKIDYIHHG